MYHSIRFNHDSLTFSASHFITFDNPEKVEALHGHNFRLEVEISGPMNRQSYIVDFVIAFDILKKICEALSHKVLLPRDHPFITIKKSGDNLQVSMPPLVWAFPAADTAVLPLKNVTTEALADYILTTLRKMLLDAHAFEFSDDRYIITVAIEESAGMWAISRDQ